MLIYAVIYTITTIAITMISLILIKTSAKTSAGKWYGLFLLFTTSGFYVSLLKLWYQTYPSTIIWFFVYLLTTIGYRSWPYLYFLANLAHAEIIDVKGKKGLKLLLVIPLLLLYISDIYNIHEIFTKQNFHITNMFWLTTLVAFIYFAAGYVLCFYAFIRDKNQANRRSRILTVLLNFLIFPVAIIVYNIYPVGAWTWMVVGQLFVIYAVLLIAFVIRNKILGYKVKIEISSSMRAANSGTSLLNHTLKNEMAKIKLCLQDLSEKYQIKSDDDLQFINLSVEYITQMMNRIQEKTQDITLIIRKKEINQIINQALLQSKPLLESKNIVAMNHCKIKAILLCDDIHLREVFCNLISNSVEAIQENGKLNIDIYKGKKELVLEIKDNGKGIKKENIPHLFEPFFTTKNRQTNYGLGLTYCYNVMKEHKGIIEIISDEGKGTSVLLKFPLSKVVHLSINQDHEYQISNSYQGIEQAGVIT
jgi:signal transduction histidine kinase